MALRSASSLFFSLSALPAFRCLLRPLSFSPLWLRAGFIAIGAIYAAAMLTGSLQSQWAILAGFEGRDVEALMRTQVAAAVFPLDRLNRESNSARHAMMAGLPVAHAAAQIDAAIEQDPGSLLLLFYRVVVAVRDGDRASAEQAFARMKDLGGDAEMIERTRQLMAIIN